MKVTYISVSQMKKVDDLVINNIDNKNKMINTIIFDVYGARQVRMKTIWVNRKNKIIGKIDEKLDFIVKKLTDINGYHIS